MTGLLLVAVGFLALAFIAGQHFPTRLTIRALREDEKRRLAAHYTENPPWECVRRYTNATGGVFGTRIDVIVLERFGGNERISFGRACSDKSIEEGGLVRLRLRGAQDRVGEYYPPFGDILIPVPQERR